MDIEKLTENPVFRISPRLAGWLFDRIKHLPVIREKIREELDAMMADLEDSVKPYRGQVPTFSDMPEKGVGQERVLEIMTELQGKEAGKWQAGYVSGAVYHGDEAHIGFLNRVYALNSQSNPLHSDIWPSAAKYEAEIVSMTAKMLGADKTDDRVCGVVSSGGTESILLAMKTYRDRAKKTKNITTTEMINPKTSHVCTNRKPTK